MAVLDPGEGKGVCVCGGGGVGVFPRILDRDVPRRFLNPNPV